jgi:hypothetical protein
MFLISCMDAVGPLVLIRRYSTTMIYCFIVDRFKAPCGTIRRRSFGSSFTPRSLPGKTPTTILNLKFDHRLLHIDDIRDLCVSGDVSTCLKMALEIFSHHFQLHGQQLLVRLSLTAFDDPPCFNCDPCHYLRSSLCNTVGSKTVAMFGGFVVWGVWRSGAWEWRLVLAGSWEVLLLGYLTSF